MNQIHHVTRQISLFRIDISFQHSHPDLIFNVIKEIGVQGSFVAIFKVLNQIAVVLIYWRKKNHNSKPERATLLRDFALFMS